MSKDTRDEALARHRDLHDPLNSDDNERLAKIQHAKI